MVFETLFYIPGSPGHQSCVIYLGANGISCFCLRDITPSIPSYSYVTYSECEHIKVCGVLWLSQPHGIHSHAVDRCVTF